jgi:aminoglycoside phosphotransferase (APT) family kinase protein
MIEPVLNEVFETDQMRAAAAAGLATIDERPIEVTPINRGNRKQTAIVRFIRRGPVVVQLTAEQMWLRTEAALLNEIRQRTFVPVPPVLAAGTHDDIAYMLTAYVAGDDLHSQFATLDSVSQCTLAHWFGRALARLHEAFIFDGYGRLRLSDGTFTAHSTDLEPWFHHFTTQAVDRLPAAFDPIRNELDALLNGVSIDTDTPSRLFPWDFRPGNALVDDGSVTAVLDWEAPLAAPPALSVAKSQYLVADWYVDDPKPVRTSFKNGYNDIRTFPTIRPAYRAAAIAESAVDSTGTVTNPHYPPVGRREAIAFHLDALQTIINDT